MSNKYLQSFLDARLFNLGEDNTTYQNLTATIPLIEKVLSRDKIKILTYTLVLLDTNTPQEDPVFDEVEELLKKKWQLLRNRYTERPTTLLRAIIIDALFKLAVGNRYFANAIWLTGSNRLPYLDPSPENDILIGWLEDIGQLAEKNAMEEWRLLDADETIDIPNFSMGKLSLTGVTLDKAGLKTGLSEAAGNGQTLASIQNMNYNSAQGNIKAEWVEEFSTKASETFFNIFSGGFNSLTKSINALNFDKPINDFFDTFKNGLRETLANTVQSTQKLRLRNEVLWWKEALYSATGRESYREQSPSRLSVISAVDLSSIIPPIYPNSIDYILKEVIRICRPEEAKISFESLATELAAEKAIIPLDIEPNETGRISISAFLKLVVSKNEEISNMKQRTGISPETLVGFGQLAVMFLHDIKASKLLMK